MNKSSFHLADTFILSNVQHRGLWTCQFCSSKCSNYQATPALSNNQFKQSLNVCFSCVLDVKVEMTAPVSCLVNPGAGPACETSFTVSFFIPEEHQADPPRPTDLENIFVESRKPFTAYVRYAEHQDTWGGRLLCAPTDMTKQNTL